MLFSRIISVLVVSYSTDALLFRVTVDSLLVTNNHVIINLSCSICNALVVHKGLASPGAPESEVVQFSLPGDDVPTIVEHLHHKQGTQGEFSEYIAGYEKEIHNMLGHRLRLLDSTEEIDRVWKEHPVVSLRPQLEWKKDGRRKMRLLLQGFKEPEEWDNHPNSSPVVKLSTIRSLLYRASRGSGDLDEDISAVDVSFAFLQAERYGPDEPPKYVSLKAGRGGGHHLFQLLGPIYGQRSASRAWYVTLSDWLLEVGFECSKNDPCLFVNSETGVQLAIHVDDIICRGNMAATVDFYNQLGAKFDIKDLEFLEPGDTLCFTGLEVSREVVAGQDWYYLSQISELQELLVDADLLEVPLRDSPMPERRKMLKDRGEVSEAERK